MLLMGLIWLSACKHRLNVCSLYNVEIFCTCATAFLQEGSDVGWMTKILSINFWQGGSFLSSSHHPDSL
jgi:hypothetical protein